MSADFLTWLRLTAALEYNSTFPVFRGTRLAAKSKIEKLHALCGSFLLALSLPALQMVEHCVLTLFRSVIFLLCHSVTYLGFRDSACESSMFSYIQESRASDLSAGLPNVVYQVMHESQYDRNMLPAIPENVWSRDGILNFLTTLLSPQAYDSVQLAASAYPCQR